MANVSNEISTRSGDNKGFIHAVMGQDTEAVAYYLSIGMDVNFLDPEIMTSPLIEAVRSNNRSMIQQMLDQGGDPQRTSQLGESAIGIAKQRGDKELLVQLGHTDSYLSRFINFWRNVFS